MDIYIHAYMQVQQLFDLLFVQIDIPHMRIYIHICTVVLVL
jgi:hypothetical protein